MNTELKEQKPKERLWKRLFKLMNDSVFSKTMGNVRKHRDINLVTTNRRRNHSVSEPNCHTTKRFSKNLLAIEMKKNESKNEWASISSFINTRNVKPYSMSFDMTILNQSINTMQNYAT